MSRSAILARAGALAMGLAATWNIGVSTLRLVSMPWLGLLWLLPIALAIPVVLLALVVVIAGARRSTIAGPLLGAAVSLMSLNPFALVLDGIALAAMVGAAMARRREAVG